MVYERGQTGHGDDAARALFRPIKDTDRALNPKSVYRNVVR